VPQGSESKCSPLRISSDVEAAAKRWVSRKGNCMLCWWCVAVPQVGALIIELFGICCEGKKTQKY
jgi:hypothetical protein